MAFSRQNHANIQAIIQKPRNLDKMIKIMEILYKNISFRRVDLYEINGDIYFGKLTFCPSAEV